MPLITTEDAGELQKWPSSNAKEKLWALELCHVRSAAAQTRQDRAALVLPHAAGAWAEQPAGTGALRDLPRCPFSAHFWLDSCKSMLDPFEKSANIPGNLEFPKCFLALMKSRPFLMVCVLDETRHEADVPRTTFPMKWKTTFPSMKGHHVHFFKHTLKSLSISGLCSAHERCRRRLSVMELPTLAQPVELPATLLPSSPQTPAPALPKAGLRAFRHYRWTRCDAEVCWSSKKVQACRTLTHWVKPRQVLSTHPRQSARTTGSSGLTKQHRAEKNLLHIKHI